MIINNILQKIGNTTLMELTHVVPEGSARIFVKLENENPTGSMKDRMALAMIEAAEESGELKAGGHVIEYTGGSTGASLALVCNVKGYSLSIVTSDAFSLEKRNHMKALGAELTIIKSDGGRMTKQLTLDMIEAARIIAEEKNGFCTDQLNNANQINGYHALGEEIWQQLDGNVGAFVQMVGTAASFRGVSETLKRHEPNITLIAVEPAESAVLSGDKTGSHKIEGVGAGFIVPLWAADLPDDIKRISTEDAMRMARRLAEEEALFVGTSTGGNVLAALEVARNMTPNQTVVTLAVDSGVKYLSTPLFSSQ
ncbi:cysteine synthase family protein [bacterium AH-315-B06]|nr:cysteine synthase family protein [bacterium AH-315-B06]